MFFDYFNGYDEVERLLGEERIKALLKAEKHCYDLYQECIYVALVRKSGRSGEPIVFTATPYQTEKKEICYDVGVEEGMKMACYRSSLNLGGVYKLSDSLKNARSYQSAKKEIRDNVRVGECLYELGK